METQTPQVEKETTDIKNAPKSKLFDKVKAQSITDTTPVLVKIIAGTEREGIDRRSGQANFGVFVTDGGKLPTLNHEDRHELKGVVFAHESFAEKIIDDELGAGFEDELGNVYFLMAPQLPNKNTYWIREISPYVIAYAQKLRANPDKLQQLMNEINQFED